MLDHHLVQNDLGELEGELKDKEGDGVAAQNDICTLCQPDGYAYRPRPPILSRIPRYRVDPLAYKSLR